MAWNKIVRWSAISIGGIAAIITLALSRKGGGIEVLIHDERTTIRKFNEPNHPSRYEVEVCVPYDSRQNPPARLAYMDRARGKAEGEVVDIFMRGLHGVSADPDTFSFLPYGEGPQAPRARVKAMGDTSERGFDDSSKDGQFGTAVIDPNSARVCVRGRAYDRGYDYK